MIGIYIHIPFCIKKCNYCDFYSISDYSMTESYFNTLKNEIRNFSNKYGRLKIDSVFFGGGTPSSVNEKYIIDIIKTLNEFFVLSCDAEITLEANPKTFSYDKLLLYRNAGVNRLSMGLQSSDNDKLKTLGRIHNREEFEKSYFIAKKAGFSNINVDIMYGLPGETKKSINDTLDMLSYLNPPHISAYALTLSENTPIYNMNLSFPSDDSVYESYMRICEHLADYRHYEISNFGKIPCRHNMLYWKREEYIGFGASASGFFGGIRYTNKSNIKSYIEDFNIKEELCEVNQADVLFECVMLGLRMDEGINTEKLKENFSCDIYKNNSSYIESLIKSGYMKETKNGIALTDKGFFVSNSIISSLVL